MLPFFEFSFELITLRRCETWARSSSVAAPVPGRGGCGRAGLLPCPSWPRSHRASQKLPRCSCTAAVPRATESSPAPAAAALHAQRSPGERAERARAKPSLCPGIRDTPVCAVPHAALPARSSHPDRLVFIIISCSTAPEAAACHSMHGPSHRSGEWDTGVPGLGDPVLQTQAQIPRVWKAWRLFQPQI